MCYCSNDQLTNCDKMACKCPLGLFLTILLFGALCIKTVHCEETGWLQRMLTPLGQNYDTTHFDRASPPDPLTVLWGIPDTQAHVGTLFKFTLPNNAFQGYIQNYQVQAAGDDVLPPWLYFNQTDRTFLGVPGPLDLGPCAVEVTAIQQDVRVTTHFIIQVTSRTDHQSLWSFSSGSADPLQMLQDYPITDKTLCNWNQMLIQASLILDDTFSDLTARERVKLLQIMSTFLTRNTNVIHLMPKRRETIKKLLNKEILIAGPGNVNHKSTSEGIELSWVVGCHVDTKVNDLANVIEHNVQGGRFASELQHNIIGWYISSIKPPEPLRKLFRKRRAVGTNQTPLATPSISVIPVSQFIMPTATIEGDVTVTLSNEVFRSSPEPSTFPMEYKPGSVESSKSPTRTFVDPTATGDKTVSVSLSSVITPSLPVMDSVALTSGTLVSTELEGYAATRVPPVVSTSSQVLNSAENEVESTVDHSYNGASSRSPPSKTMVANHSIPPETAEPVLDSSFFGTTSSSTISYAKSASLDSTGVDNDHSRSTNFASSVTSPTIVPSQTDTAHIDSTAVLESSLYGSVFDAEIISSHSASMISAGPDSSYSADFVFSISHVIVHSRTDTQYLDSTAVSKGLPADDTAVAKPSSTETQRLYTISESLFYSSITGPWEIEPSVLPVSSSLDLSVTSYPSNAIHSEMISHSVKIVPASTEVSSVSTLVTENSSISSNGSDDTSLRHTSLTMLSYESSARPQNHDLIKSSVYPENTSQSYVTSTSQVLHYSSIIEPSYPDSTRQVSNSALQQDDVTGSFYDLKTNSQSYVTTTPQLPDSSNIFNTNIQHSSPVPTIASTELFDIGLNNTQAIHITATLAHSSIISPLYEQETVSPSADIETTDAFYSNTESTLTSNEVYSSEYQDFLRTSSVESSILTSQSLQGVPTPTQATGVFLTQTVTLPWSDSLSEPSIDISTTATPALDSGITSMYLFDSTTKSDIFNATDHTDTEILVEPTSESQNDSIVLPSSAWVPSESVQRVASVTTEGPYLNTNTSSVTTSEEQTAGLSSMSSSSMSVFPTEETTSYSITDVTESHTSATISTDGKHTDATDVLSVTAEYKLSTTKTPILPARTTESASGPVLVQPLDPIYIQIGRYFEYKISSKTFSTSQNGRLQLDLLSYDASPLPSDSWLMLDQDEEFIYGLPVIDQVNDTHAFLLTATDSMLRRAVALVVFHVEGPERREPSHQFNLTLDFDFKDFKSSVKNLITVVKLLSSYCGDDQPDNITVMGVTPGSVILSWTNNSLSQIVCESDSINTLYGILYNDGITTSLRQHIYPFVPLKITVELLGVCSVKAAQASKSGTNMLLVSILVPIFILFLGLFLLVCFCGYCQSRKVQQGKLQLDEDAPVFAANRKPVLLEGELELHEMKHGSTRPMEMSRDFNDFFEPSFYPESPIKKPPSYNGMHGAYNFAFESDDISSNRSSPPEYKSQKSSPNRSPPLYRLPPPYPRFV